MKMWFMKTVCHYDDTCIAACKTDNNKKKVCVKTFWHIYKHRSVGGCRRPYNDIEQSIIIIMTLLLLLFWSSLVPQMNH